MDHDELLRIIDQAAKDGVTFLNLSNRGITELPPEIEELTKLTALDLSYNQLNKLPATFGKLTNLSGWLDLGYNQFSDFPKPVIKLKSLEGLALGGNQLTILPPEIGKGKDCIFDCRSVISCLLCSFIFQNIASEFYHNHLFSFRIYWQDEQKTTGSDDPARGVDYCYSLF